MVDIFDIDENDPVSAAKDAASAITAARKAVLEAGVSSFLFQASTVEEFDQRAEFGGVSGVIEEIADKYLGSPDQHAKLLASLRREYAQSKWDPREDLLPEDRPYPGPGWGTRDQCYQCHGKFDDMQLARGHGLCVDCLLEPK